MLSIGAISYLETALWSTVDYQEPSESDGPYGPDTYNLDDKYTIDDISEEFKKQAQTDWDTFYAMAQNLFTEDELDFSQIAHDFWLTRNRHGVGFWDGDYEKGEELTDLVHKHFKENSDDLRDSVGHK